MSEEDFFGNHNSVFLPNDEEHNFGNYTIVGRIYLAGCVEQKNVYSELYLNSTYDQWFLVKIFPSNKIHIDFFIRSDDFRTLTMSDDHKRIEAFTQDNSKELGWYGPKKCYYVTSFFNGKKHTLFFDKN